MGTSIVFNYILDSYKEVAGEGIVTAILFRNSMGKWALCEFWVVGTSLTFEQVLRLRMRWSL